MPIPLIPIIQALLAGGLLVPHAAGGMIVTSTAGYVAGTYLSTAAVTGIVTAVGAGAVASVGTLTAFASRLLARTAATSVATTTVGTTTVATGVATTGTVAAATTGLVTFLPAILSITAGLSAFGLGYKAYQFYQLKSKVSKTTEGNEILFTEKEAKMVEDVIKSIAKKDRQ
jgi:hypothetical protein